MCVHQDNSNGALSAFSVARQKRLLFQMALDTHKSADGRRHILDKGNWLQWLGEAW